MEKNDIEEDKENDIKNNVKKEKKNNTIKVLLIIIIILLIAIAFLFFGRLNDYIPTGGIDVFYIDLTPNSGNNSGDKTDTTAHIYKTINVVDSKRETIDSQGNTINQQGTTTVELPIYTEDDIYTTGRVFVDDENGDYIYQEKLNIFTNPMYEMKEIIAPGSSNTYSFAVHNSVNGAINYKIKMIEKTEYPINMKYRLKLNNEYIIGDSKNWVSADKLEVGQIYLAEGDVSVYSLEWKWFDDDDEQDTIAGTNMTSLYQLNIKINFDAAVN
jgi:hypothetical protein